MRLGLIGDVHAENERLRVALHALRGERVAGILCSGDLVDGHGDVDRTCSLLLENRVITVRGNHDRWIRDDEKRALPNAHRMTELEPATIGMLKSLPSTLHVSSPLGTLLLCHGVGENDMQKLGPDDRGLALASNDALMKVLLDETIAIMVCGHTHVAMVRRFERGIDRPPLVVVNAGTLAREGQPGFAVLDTIARRVDFHAITEDGGTRPTSRAVL
jgi:predicted phosphodiesterase